MKLEELIAALNTSNIDMTAQEEIIVWLNRYENAQESEYFTVLETNREGMKYRYADSPHLLARIDKLTDKQMEEIAIGVGDQLIEHYWDALELAVKAELEEGK